METIQQFEKFPWEARGNTGCCYFVLIGDGNESYRCISRVPNYPEQLSQLPNNKFNSNFRKIALNRTNNRARLIGLDKFED